MAAGQLPTVSAVRPVLGEPRFDRYADEVKGDLDLAVELYGWNARLSAAFILPAHFAEVAVRNAVSEAIASAYDDMWPWNPGFEGSLPAKEGGRSPRNYLTQARKGQSTTGKVIAELKFVFWERMFTARFDERLWDPFLMTVMPNAAASPVPVLRAANFR